MRQRRAVNSFLSSTNSIDRISYLRVIALASVDISLTLPMNVASLVLRIITLVEANSPPFYLGWSALHANLKPIRVPYALLQEKGYANLVHVYFSYWTSPVFGLVIFGLFGLTEEVRESYWSIFDAIRNRLGCKRASTARDECPTLGEIEFRPQLQDPDVPGFNSGPRCVHAMSGHWSKA